MTFKNFFNKGLAILIVGSLLFTACQNGKKPVNTEQTKIDSTNVADIAKNVKDVVYPLPTPFEMARILNDMGARYVLGSLNAADNVDKYFTEKSRALNLGVYMADVAYAATYDQKQDVKVYSKPIKTLVDKLGVNIDYNTLLSDKNREVMNNKDSIVKEVTNSLYGTYKYLNDKNNPDLAIEMATGLWVELMYIATHISEDTYHNTGIVNLVVGQRASYTKLLALVSSRNANPDLKQLQDKLIILKPVFDKVDSGLKQPDYELILKTIQSIRVSIVS